VKVEAILTNPTALGMDKTLIASAYLRTNGNNPLTWQNQDIGDVGATGTATESGNSWTIEASGFDIWDTSDEFHYVYRSLSGDGQIIARVVSIDNWIDTWAKSGVMIRETLDATSKHAMMIVTPGNGMAFQQRTSTGGGSDHTAGSSVQAPFWVKLTRSGNTLTGYESPNGFNWTQVDSVSITMASNVYVGLAVTSHNDGTLCTSQIDNVNVSNNITTANALIPQTTSPPTIDGSVDSLWSNATAYSIAKVVVGSVSSGSDFSGTWKALWDTSNIYYLVDITDDNLYNDSGTSRWDDDLVEIMIDADNSKGGSYDSVNDFQYGFRWNDNTIGIGTYSVDNTTGVDFNIVNTSNGYRLEASIPWSTLGVTPSLGYIIGAEIYVDDDDDGGNRDAQVSWYTTSPDAWQNPSVMGTAELVESDSGNGDEQILP